MAGPAAHQRAGVGVGLEPDDVRRAPAQQPADLLGHDVEHARRVICGRCTDQVGYLACQGGLGYEKPVTSFTVRNGKVVGVFMAAVDD